MEAKDLYPEVKSLPIQSVIGKYVELKKHGSTYDGLCPFHADSHTGSFKVNPNKKSWKCYVCGIYGDATDFVSRIEGISPKEAVFKIAVAEGLVSASEAEDLRTGRTIQKQIRRRKQIPVNTPRSIEHCADVYQAFTEACNPLTDEHVRHLKDVRKIKDQDMHLFFEWPSPSDADFWHRFEQRLREKGFFESAVEAVKYVPGFAFNAEEGRPYFMSGHGIGLKLYDSKGTLRGLQLRQDKVKAGLGRYKLFSSSWAAQNLLSEPNKWDGASFGQVPDIILPEKPVTGIAVTEGKFKALQLKRFGYETLSVNGVNSWSYVLPELLSEAKARNIGEIHIYYDADMTTNPGVKKAALALAEAIEKEGVTPYFITWDIALGKGIDDMLLNGHKKELVKRSMSEIKGNAC